MKRNYALDGIKGIAIIAIVLYHYCGQIFPGGFIGVDVFFTLTGFLITLSLIKDFMTAWNKDQGLMKPGQWGKYLGHFYLRRLRRLLPAMIVMIPTVTILAWFINKDALVGLGKRILASVTFSYNYYSIFTGGSYFDQSVPNLLEPLWFLAICAQFYLLAPLYLSLIFAAVLHKKSAKQTARGGKNEFSATIGQYLQTTAVMRSVGLMGALVSTILSFASAAAMGIIFHADPSHPTRVYFDLGTHSFGLLLGAAFAFALVHSQGIKLRGVVEQAFLESTCTPRQKVLADLADRMNPKNVANSRFAQTPLGKSVLPLISFLSLIVFCCLTYGLTSRDAAFQGVLFLTAFLTLGMLWGTMPRKSWMKAIFVWKPLRLAGKYSYGIYLWHWPLYILLRLLFPSLRGRYEWLIALLACLVTLIMTWLSARYVEEPRRLASNLQRVVVMGLVVVLWIGCLAIIGHAPAQTSIQSQLQEQERVLASQTGKEPSSRKPSRQREKSAKTPSKRPSASQSDRSSTASPKSVVMPSGSRITAVGDSVMLGSASALQARFPGIVIDAKVSRFLYEGAGTIANLKARGLLRQYLIISLGTNAAGSPQQWEDIYRTAGPGHIFVVVNAHMDRSWAAASNRNAQDFVNRHPHEALLVNWDAAARSHPQLLSSDGIHPTPAGAPLYAGTIYDALHNWLQSR